MKSKKEAINSKENESSLGGVESVAADLRGSAACGVHNEDPGSQIGQK